MGWKYSLILTSHFNPSSSSMVKFVLPSSPFFTILRTVSPCEAFPYGQINWSLAQVQQQSALGLSQSATSLQGDKTRFWPSFWFNVQKQHVAESSGGSVAKKFCSEPGKESCKSDGKSSDGGVFTSVT